MRHTLLFFILLFSIIGSGFAQSIRNLDNPVTTTQSAKAGLLKAQTQPSAETNEISAEEFNTIEELTSTIEALLLENGEKINIAKQRGVPCHKADADISTFIQFTGSQNSKKEIVTACSEVQLIRFSFLNVQDFELAKSIDFSILNQFPQLKYVVFYVNPSVYKQQSSDLQKEQIERKLEELIPPQSETNSFKIFYRIPQGG